MVFTLVDPCDPPTSMTGEDLTNQVYTITDDVATPYLHPDFDVEPSYCPLIYSYTKTPLDDGDSALGLPTSDDKTFTFYYDKNLDPLT